MTLRIQCFHFLTQDVGLQATVAKQLGVSIRRWYWDLIRFTPLPSLSIPFPFLPFPACSNTAAGLEDRCKLAERGAGRSPGHNFTL